jgi:hypothetical protein
LGITRQVQKRGRYGCLLHPFLIPLGHKTGGGGDLFPRIRKDFREKSSIPGLCGGDYLFMYSS